MKINHRSIMKVIVIFITTIVIISIAVLNNVYATGETNRYVSKSGVDSGDCTVSPCLTINYAIIQSLSGDTIHIAEGTYDINLLITKNISFIGDGMSKTILDGNKQGRVINIPQGIEVSLIDLSIRNGDTSGISVDNDGGGISNLGTTSLLRVNVSENVGEAGGGIYSEGALNITDTQINNNIAVHGGGIYSSGPTTILDSIISENFASVILDGRGGGIFIAGSEDSMVLLNRVLLIGNAANNLGGAIFNTSGLNLQNVTINNNVAQYGSGIFNDSFASANVTFSTIANNYTTDGGSTGGVRNYSTISFKNSIIAGNYPSNCFNGGVGVWTSLGYNIESSSTCNFNGEGDLQDTNPLLGTIQDNGGPTMTLALLAGSPAIDAGSTVGCPATDQRGVTRPFGATCDIGAYEYQVDPGTFSKVNPATGKTGNPINLTLSWETSTNVESYEYCYDTSDDGLCTEWTNTGTSTSVPLTNLLPGTTYYWQVKANNSFSTTYADGNETAFWSFQTGNSPDTFGKSSPLDAANHQSINPVLSWGESIGATSYQYCYDTSNDNTCSLWVNNSNETSFALSGLSLDTTYFWQVRAINGFGTTYADGSETTFWYFTTGNVPDAFTKVAPIDDAIDQSISPSLTWSASPEATSYQYCYDTSNDNACSTWQDNGSETSIALSGLTINTTYYWQVKAINSFGATYADGSETAFRSFTTGNIPAAFSKISPLDQATDQTTNITLNWQTSNYADKYEYCIDTTDDNACADWTDAGTNTSKLLAGINPGYTYYWNVRSVNIHGITYANGSSNSWWSFTVSNKPGYFIKNAPSNNAMRQSLNPTISWTPSFGASSYQYCVSTESPCTNWINNGLATSKTLAGLSLGTTYYWNVRAVNSYGKSYADLSKDNWSFKTGTKPEAFKKISPTNSSTGQSLEAVFSWNESGEASSYEYCFDTTNDNKCNTSWKSSGTSTSIQLSGLTRSTTYYWQVRARNNFGKTMANNGNWWAFTTTTLKPDPFSKIAPMNGATNQLINSILTWEPSLNTVRFEYCIDRINDNICTTGWQSVGTDTSVTLSGLKPGKKYFWLVRAINTFGKTKSNEGAWWAFTTTP